MTSLGRTTTALTAIACALILVALLWAGAPRSEDELEQLRRATAQGEAALHLARLGCELIEDPERRADCHQALGVVALPVEVARGVLATADACAAGDDPCRAAQLAQARALLPEVRRVVEELASRPPDPEVPSEALPGEGPTVGVGPAPSAGP